MRKILVFCLLLVAGMAIAEPSYEAPVYTAEKPMVVMVATAVPFAGEWIEKMTKPFVTEHPNTAIRTLALDYSDGTTSAQKAYLASGMRIALLDYGGRIGELMVPEYALDLRPYLDTADFYPDQLALVTRGGAVLGVPFPGTQQLFMVNKTVLDEVGYTVPENWTTDDFLAMCALVKAKRPDIIPFNWYCGELNADYYFMHILAWFGAELYQGGDYTKTAINSKQGLAAFTFIKQLYDLGYMPADTITRKAGDYLSDQYKGKCASFSTFSGSTPPGIANLVKQGTLKEPWVWQVVPFPRGPGVAKVKAFNMQWGILAPRSDYIPLGASKRKPKDKVWDDTYGEFAVKAAEFYTYTTKVSAVFPVRKAQEGYFAPDLTLYPDVPFVAALKQPAWDQGLFVKTYSAARFKAFAEFQAMLGGKKTPAEALASYAAELDKVLEVNK